MHISLSCVYTCEHCVYEHFCEHVWKTYFSTNFLWTRGKWRTNCELFAVAWKLLARYENLPANMEENKNSANTVLTEPQTSFVFVEKTDWRWFTMNCLRTRYTSWGDGWVKLYEYGWNFQGIIFSTQGTTLKGETWENR